MSQEVANAKAIGRAVGNVTSAVSLGDQISTMKTANARKKAKVLLKKKQAEKNKEKPSESQQTSSNSSSTSQGPKNVKSERVHYPNPQKSIKGPQRALGAPSETFKPTGPAAISAPGPTAKEQASKKAAKAKKGTKNTSTIKVAEPSVDLESPTGGMTYKITDLPRQWNKNGNN